LEKKMLRWFTGPEVSSKQVLQEAQKSIRQGVRDIERERNKLIQRESDRTIEIRNMAAKGQMAVVRIMAKELVRTRASIAKFYAIQAELENVSSTMATMNSTALMADVMRTSARSLMRMNAVQSLPALQQVMRTFAKEHDQMSMKQEAMNDAMDSVMDTSESAGDQETLIDQVLDEIGIQVAGKLQDAPSGAKGKEEDDAKIFARLAELRK
jgi:division protein CdvB (Snf7/Vps24/ESCRT-III family)